MCEVQGHQARRRGAGHLRDAQTQPEAGI